MTNEEMLEVMQLRIADDDMDASDELLLTCIEEAGEVIYNRLYPFRDDMGDVPERYHRRQIEIAMYLFTKIGSEGETMHTEGQTTRMYEKGGVPDSLLKGVVPLVGYWDTNNSTEEETSSETP